MEHMLIHAWILLIDNNNWVVFLSFFALFFYYEINGTIKIRFSGQNDSKNQSDLIDMKYTFIFSAKDYALISDSDSIVLTDQNIPPKSWYTTLLNKVTLLPKCFLIDKSAIKNGVFISLFMSGQASYIYWDHLWKNRSVYYYEDINSETKQFRYAQKDEHRSIYFYQHFQKEQNADA